jgi:signal transduction histidine kinase
MLLLVAIQHGITSGNVYTNIIWLPVFLFVSHAFLESKYHWPITIIGILFFSLAVLKQHYYPNIFVEKSQGIESLVTNLAVIALGSLASLIASRTTIGEDQVIKEMLSQKRDMFRQLNYNNAALSSMITHDIASPLTIAQITLNKLPDSAEKKRIQNNLDKINSIITNARQLRAMKSGKLQITLSDINLSEVLRDIVNNFQDQLKPKNLSLILNIPNSEIYIQAEKNSLYTSVLNNLIQNAIKFSPPNNKIDIFLTEEEDTITLNIQDYGIGIPPKLQSKLFDFTANTSRQGTAGERGTGFGLPLVKLFCDIYECEITVTSSTETPSGTTFTLTFKKGTPNDQKLT